MLFRSHCADWNRGQRARPFTSLPLGPRRPDNEPSRPLRLPRRLVSSQPRPRPAPRPQGLQPGALGGGRDPGAGGLSPSGLVHSQVFLSREPQFPTRLQGLRQRLFRTDGRALPSGGEGGGCPGGLHSTLPPRRRSRGARRPRPASSRRQSPDFDRSPGRRRRQAKGEERNRAPAPARSPLLPQALESPRRVTAALRLQRRAPLLAPDSWGLRVGACRFKIRPRRTPAAALREGDAAPPPLLLPVPSFA